jgi:hypothetical protein
MKKVNFRDVAPPSLIDTDWVAEEALSSSETPGNIYRTTGYNIAKETIFILVDMRTWNITMLEQFF